MTEKFFIRKVQVIHERMQIIAVHDYHTRNSHLASLASNINTKIAAGTSGVKLVVSLKVGDIKTVVLDDPRELTEAERILFANQRVPVNCGDE
jgi:hypothetical protein